MVITRRLRAALIVAVAALAGAAVTIVLNSSGAGHRQVAAPQPATSPPTPPATAAATPSKTAAAPAPSANADSFSLVVRTQSGDIAAQVESISVASNQPVDAPHNTAAQWNTAVWVKQSSYPSAASNGTSYVYGHACHHHVCAFTQLKNAGVGDQVTVTTPAASLIYRIARVGLAPKAASSLPSWASDSTVPNRLVLVTCAFEQGDTSTENLVVVAQRQGT